MKKIALAILTLLALGFLIWRLFTAGVSFAKGNHGKSEENVPGYECEKGKHTGNPHCPASTTSTPKPTPERADPTPSPRECRNKTQSPSPTVSPDSTPTPTATPTPSLTPTPTENPCQPEDEGELDAHIVINKNCETLTPTISPQPTTIPTSNQEWQEEKKNIFPGEDSQFGPHK